MSNILIVAATNLELKPIKLKLQKHKKHNVIYFVHQVGIPLSLFEFQNFIHKQKNNFDLLIQVGIAGSFDFKLPLGSVWDIRQDCFGDMGVMENKELKNIFDLGFIQKQKAPFKNGLLINPNKIKLKIPTTNAITVQQISTNKNQIAILKKKYNCSIESMEGASFFLVCLSYKIKCLQIRAISNYIGERSKEKWKIKEALENLANAVQGILNEIK